MYHRGAAVGSLLVPLNVARCSYRGTGQIFVFPKMGRQQARHSITAAPCLPNCLVQLASRWVTVPIHSVLLKDQADPMPVGTEEFIIQCHAVLAGCHIFSPSGVTQPSSGFHAIRLPEQIVYAHRVMPSFPIHADHSRKGRSVLRRFVQQRTSWNHHRDFCPSSLIQQTRYRSFCAILRHSSLSVW